MDVYGESGKRAHRTGVVGVDSETEDTVDNLEVYEALVNPKESNSGGNKGRGGMMPPMMMGGGAGAGAGSSAAAASTAGATQAAATAGATARAVPGPMAAGAATGAPAASPGVGTGSAGAAGTPSVGGGGGGLPTGAGAGVPGGALGGGALGSGVLAAGSEDTAVADEDGSDPDQDQPQDVEDEGSTGGEGSVDPTGRIVPVPPQDEQPPGDVVEVDPAQIERLAKQWSSLSDSMTGLSSNINNLQADAGAFGMVRDPEPVYGKMTDGLHRRSGGAAAEFEQISAGLAASAQAFRNTEDEATATLGEVVQ